MHIIAKALLTICLITGTAFAQASDFAPYTNQIIVKFKSGTISNGQPSAQMRRSLQAVAGKTMQFKRVTSGQAQVYSLDQMMPISDVRQIAERLMLRDDVEYAEPDARRYPQLVPNDTGYPNQWYFSEAAGGTRAQEAWDTTTGSSATVIAVIDTGILAHSDISRVLSGYDFISADSPGVFTTANDGNGRDTDPSDPGDAVAINECGAGSAAQNSSWHGTIITGMLAADTADADGIAGIDHNGFVVPIRVLGKCGGFVSDIADAIRWAAGLAVSGAPNNANPADVINLSFGAAGACSATEQSAIDAAVATNAVIVAAAGNEGNTEITAPANCNNVIAVAATTREGGETCYTNVNALVDISAPGGNDNDVANGCSGVVTDGIYSTSNTGTTTPVAETLSYAIGTSFSTPLVAGAAALMKGIDPNLTPNSIESILKNTARVFPVGTMDSFRDCTTANCGAGLLDMQGAVIAATNGGLDSTPNPFSFSAQTGVAVSTSTTSNTVTISGIDIPANISITGGEYSIGGAAFTGANGTVNNGQTVSVRVVSSANAGSTTQATVTIGGVNATFSVSTQEASSGGGGSASWLVLLMLLLFAGFPFCIQNSRCKPAPE